MNRIKLKVCGLRDNMKEVIALDPDYAGFIFYNKSPRYVGEEFEMIDLTDDIKSVGVFVNESVKKVQQVAVKYKLEFVQLHGNETPEYCVELKRSGIKIIKAFQIDEMFDFDLLENYSSTVDYFLFDTKTSSFGGSGKTFNWNLLKRYKMEKKYFLSGGISLDNFDAVANVDLRKIEAIDVNSKFEVSPGLKNIQQIRLLQEKLLAMNTEELSDK